jgi:L-alanine-DL-glutamate epimerase-like enolase superfamily enzyme
LKNLDIKKALISIDDLVSARSVDYEVVWNASRTAVELALVDCLFRCRDVSLNSILPARQQEVTYSAVITAGTVANTEQIARRCKTEGFQYIKMKVSEQEDADKVALVRDIMGPSVSMRLDANCAFTEDTATRFLKTVEKYDIECVEQPIPRGDVEALATLRLLSPIPLMADESIVTISDAKDLIKRKAVDCFNLRISKCGGIYSTLAIADLARSAGIAIQLGCQVGETAILSAAGRHVAAHLGNLCYIEGSYGTHLLMEDVSTENITFGQGGRAPVLKGPGLGVIIREQVLEKYSQDIISVK